VFIHQHPPFLLRHVKAFFFALSPCKPMFSVSDFTCACCPPPPQPLQIKAHNLGPALEWAQQHRSKLSHEGSPAGFEFRLHELNFLNTLSSSGQAAALSYAQQHFGPFRVSGVFKEGIVHRCRTINGVCVG
jgi:hypothetical protein